MQKEVKAVMQLLRESNGSNGSFINFMPTNTNSMSRTQTCTCKQVDGNGLSPWLMDAEMASIVQCRSMHLLESTNSNKDKIRMTSRSKDLRKFITKSNSGIGDTCLKFYHFDDICDYMTQYRENITLPVLMQYRTKLSRTCGSTSCQQNELSVKECNCPKKTAVTENGWLSVAYIKQIESTLINRCYCDSPGVSVEAIIEQVKQRPNHSDINKLKKSPRKDFYSARSEGKLKRQPLSPPKCPRQTVVLGKKGNSVSQRKNKHILRLKTGCDDVDALRVISATKMKIGPRMGSNYPPNDRNINTNRFTPSTSVRRKISHVAMPRSTPSFQACIVPVALSNSEVNQ